MNPTSIPPGMEQLTAPFLRTHGAVDIHSLVKDWRPALLSRYIANFWEQVEKGAEEECWNRK